MSSLSMLATMPKIVRESLPEFGICGSGNTGRRGTPIIYQGMKYASWREAARQTGLTKAALRWRIRKAAQIVKAP